MKEKETHSELQDLDCFCRQLLCAIPLQQMIFIDESHVTRKDQCRLYGYAPKGQKVLTRSYLLTNESWSVITAIGWEGVVHYEIYDCEETAITHSEFYFFVLLLLNFLQERAQKVSYKFLLC